MKRFYLQDSGLNRDFRPAMTDIHRLKDLKNFIKASEKKLKVLQQNAKNDNEAAKEKIMLEASKQLEETLEGLILFF